jgi:hypothetical protein
MSAADAVPTIDRAVAPMMNNRRTSGAGFIGLLLLPRFADRPSGNGRQHIREWERQPVCIASV